MPNTVTGPSTTEWPMAKFFFEVDFGTGKKIGFQTCDGLEATVASMEYRDSNSSSFFKEKRPTMSSFSPVTLKKGVFSGDSSLFEWYKDVANGSILKSLRTVTISLKDHSGTNVHQWILNKAYITKFTPTGLDAEADGEVALEEMEITYTSFDNEASLLDWLF